MQKLITMLLILGTMLFPQTDKFTILGRATDSGLLTKGTYIPFNITYSRDNHDSYADLLLVGNNETKNATFVYKINATHCALFLYLLGESGRKSEFHNLGAVNGMVVMMIDGNDIKSEVKFQINEIMYVKEWHLEITPITYKSEGAILLSSIILDRTSASKLYEAMLKYQPWSIKE